MITDNQRFIGGLEHDNRHLVKAMPKSDLHTHGGLACRLQMLERWAEKQINPPPPVMKNLASMNQWIADELHHLFKEKRCAEFVIRAALAEAWNDGITLLEMSFDLTFITHFNHDPEQFARFIHDAHRIVAPEITFRPELGLARDLSPERWIPVAKACVDTGLFAGIDLYGIEDARPPEVYRELFDHARKKGLKCKVHAGEFEDAAAMMHTINVLQPHAVQHGIAAAASEDAMQYLAKAGITLNICPTSNIRLSRVTDYQNHPIRKLFYAGVSVTINTDDIMVFDASVTDEYFHLFHAGILPAAELNEIRLNGLKQ
jgi:adenosine deaminase